MKRFLARVFLLTYLPAIGFLPTTAVCCWGETIEKQIKFHGRLEICSPRLSSNFLFGLLLEKAESGNRGEKSSDTDHLSSQLRC